MSALYTDLDRTERTLRDAVRAWDAGAPGADDALSDAYAAYEAAKRRAKFAESKLRLGVRGGQARAYREAAERQLAAHPDTHEGHVAAAVTLAAGPALELDLALEAIADAVRALDAGDLDVVCEVVQAARYLLPEEEDPPAPVLLPLRRIK